MTPEDLSALLFQPGFSTAKFVTELSGRGMGLSVVAETMAHLQGEFEVVKRDGPGTTITLSAPLSVSTHRLLMVACKEQHYAVPLHSIERVGRFKLSEVERIENRAVIRLQGKAMPLLSLAQILGIGDSAVVVDGEYVSFLVVRASGRRAAVAVDAMLSQVEGMILNVPPQYAHVKKIVGCIQRGDGGISLVLSPVELIESLQQANIAPVLSAVERRPEAKRYTILVVDDSITTRTLEKSILEAHGYKVNVAVDGAEALEYLQTDSADLVISDVQMPRLDGFGLLEEIKKDARLSKLPFILCTSLESRTDQERGLSLGADAYIVKRKFDQRNLLETIRQIL
jgi:two-component system chemotaxis sensor kinase CheA